jgi:hypothetical protein
MRARLAAGSAFLLGLLALGITEATACDWGCWWGCPSYYYPSAAYYAPAPAYYGGYYAQPGYAAVAAAPAYVAQRAAAPYAPASYPPAPYAAIPSYRQSHGYAANAPSYRRSPAYASTWHRRAALGAPRHDAAALPPKPRKPGIKAGSSVVAMPTLNTTRPAANAWQPPRPAAVKNGRLLSYPPPPDRGPRLVAKLGIPPSYFAPRQ